MSSKSSIYCCSLADRCCAYHGTLGEERICVLDISPAKHAEDSVEVSIRVGALNGDEHYQTLSYAWGEQVFDSHVMCDGIAVPVTSHLEAGLRCVRSQQLPENKTICIDAISINQEDNAEKSSQVQLMAKIFQQSFRLLIWLGPASDEDINSLRGSIRSRATCPSSCLAMAKLVETTWFKRRWVIQEVVLSTAGRRHMLYGSFRMTLEQFISLHEWHYDRNAEQRSSPSPARWLVRQHIHHGGGYWPRGSQGWPSLLANLNLSAVIMPTGYIHSPASAGFERLARMSLSFRWTTL